MRTRRRQLGLASVEMVLVSPVILALLVLMIHMTRAMHIKQETVVNARTTAWRNALFETTCLGLVQSRFGGEVTAFGFLGIPSEFMEIDIDPGLPTAEGIATTCPSSPYGSGQEFLREMRSAGTAYDKNNELTQVLNAGPPSVISGRGLSGYEFFPYLGDGQDESVGYTIETLHALDAAPVWESSDLPIGYDNFMKQELDSDKVYLNFFPCASGPPSSAQAGNCNADQSAPGEPPPGVEANPDYDAIAEEERIEQERLEEERLEEERRRQEQEQNNGGG